MSRISQEYPFLQLLDDRTTLLDSPVFTKMKAQYFRFFKEHPNATDADYKGYVVFCNQHDVDFPGVVPLVMSITNEKWPRMMSRFRSKVALVSESFMAAGRDASEAFKKDPVKTSSYLAGKTFSGTILVSSTKHTVGYHLEFDDKGVLIDYNILWIDQVGSICSLIVPELQFISRSILFNEKKERLPYPLFLVGSPLHSLSGVFIDTVKCFILFCHYAEIIDEFVARPGSRQAREQARSGETCVNDTRYNVRRLAVTYFKNIYRDEGFPVRGHFRLQPFGTGHAERKLIYISPFMKNGYHRRAELLTGGEFGEGIKN